jgi:hypothetical protein
MDIKKLTYKLTFLEHPTYGYPSAVQWTPQCPMYGPFQTDFTNSDSKIKGLMQSAHNKVERRSTGLTHNQALGK